MPKGDEIRNEYLQIAELDVAGHVLAMLGERLSQDVSGYDRLGAGLRTACPKSKSMMARPIRLRRQVVDANRGCPHASTHAEDLERVWISSGGVPSVARRSAPRCQTR